MMLQGQRFSPEKIDGWKGKTALQRVVSPLLFYDRQILKGFFIARGRRYRGHVCDDCEELFHDRASCQDRYERLA